MGFKGRLIFDIYIEIQDRGGMSLVILKVSSEDLEWSVIINKKVFSGEAQLLCSWYQPN